MEFTDAELEETYSTLYEEVHYGDDDVVYGDTPKVHALQSALSKVTDEMKRRKLL